MNFVVSPLQTNVIWVWIGCSPDLALLKQMVQKMKKSLLPSPMGKAQTYLFSFKGHFSPFWPDFWEPRTLKRCFLKNSERFSCLSQYSWPSLLYPGCSHSLTFSLMHRDWEGSKGLEVSAMKGPGRLSEERCKCPQEQWHQVPFSQMHWMLKAFK